MFGSTPFVVVPKYTPNGDVPASVFPSVMEGILNVDLYRSGIFVENLWWCSGYEITTIVYSYLLYSQR